jgi:hypothetical protein
MDLTQQDDPKGDANNAAGFEEQRGVGFFSAGNNKS